MDQPGVVPFFHRTLPELFPKQPYGFGKSRGTDKEQPGNWPLFDNVKNLSLKAPGAVKMTDDPGIGHKI